MSSHKTTASLRETLFECINEVRSGKMTPADGKTIALMADKIIETAELELQYASILSKLDKEDQGISPGPILLTPQNTG